MSANSPTILMPNEPGATVQPSLARLRSYRDDHPSISLPPPISGPRGHQRSKTTIEVGHLVSRSNSVSPDRSSTFLPFGRSSRTTSPERSETRSISSSVSPSAASSPRPRGGAVGKLSSWFEGTSDPVNISLVPSPKKELCEPFYNVDRAMTTQDKLTARPTKRHTASPSTANSSVFSFFKKSTLQVPSRPALDDLLQVDIEEALLPDGPTEVYSQETFNTLQQNAESLIKKLQQSYAENLGMLRLMTTEKSVQEDELEACRTKNEHLKIQLLEMADKAANQEKTIMELHQQLNKHLQGIRMIAEDEPNTPERHYRRGRLSDCSSSGSSMMDSDISSAVSIFSDAESIHTAATSVAGSPIIKHARLHNPVLTPHPTLNAHITPILVPDCSNCHGVPASEAWDVIGVMKAESVGLKQRVIELENAQDAALDFLSALNL